MLVSTYRHIVTLQLTIYHVCLSSLWLAASSADSSWIQKYCSRPQRSKQMPTQTGSRLRVNDMRSANLIKHGVLLETAGFQGAWPGVV